MQSSAVSASAAEMKQEQVVTDSSHTKQHTKKHKSAQNYFKFWQKIMQFSALINF